VVASRASFLTRSVSQCKRNRVHQMHPGPSMGRDPEPVIDRDPVLRSGGATGPMPEE
jgi:hypothetical protein